MLFNGLTYIEYLKYNEYVKLRMRNINNNQRYLGIKALNKPFKNSEFHHLIFNAFNKFDPDIGIYIPRELHRSIKHSSVTWEGMNQINDLAWKFHLTNL